LEKSRQEVELLVGTQIRMALFLPGKGPYEEVKCGIWQPDFGFLPVITGGY